MAVRLEKVREALGDRFEVEREIGHSGMAAIFLARELGCDKPVVLKVLQPEFAATVGAPRFHREIMIIGSLDHPNILPSIESNEAGPLLYYVTPYAPDGSLRDRIAERGHLPVEETIEITRQVAAALDHAHGHNVLHRDIKPANILFDGDRAMVSDFGIARAIQVAGGDSLSSSGLVVGTPTYMSPEQASGVRNIDGRADIYALGCVVYEMLVGQPPFTGPTVQAMLARHTKERPPKIRVVRPDVPEQVEAAVEKALEKRAKDRPGSGAAFVEALH